MSRCEACGSADDSVEWAAIHDCWLCGRCRARGRLPDTEEYR